MPRSIQHVRTMRAARLLGAGGLRDRIALAIPPESLQRHQSVAKTLAEQLEDRYLDLVTEGLTLDPAQATAEALRRSEASSKRPPLAESLQALDDVLGSISGGDRREFAVEESFRAHITPLQRKGSSWSPALASTDSRRDEFRRIDHRNGLASRAEQLARAPTSARRGVFRCAGTTTNGPSIRKPPLTALIPCG